MRPSERSGHYSDIAIALHWLLALALVAAFCVGLYMTDLKLSPLRVRLFNWHKWAGISILVLSLFRLGWRLRHPPPESAASMSPLQKRLAEGLHYLLYAMSSWSRSPDGHTVLRPVFRSSGSAKFRSRISSR